MNARPQVATPHNAALFKQDRPLTAKERKAHEDHTAWMEMQEEAELELLRYEMTHSGGRSYAGERDAYY